MYLNKHISAPLTHEASGIENDDTEETKYPVYLLYVSDKHDKLENLLANTFQSVGNWDKIFLVLVL